MSSTVLYMSMSLDGYVAGPNEALGNGLGDGGDRLHEWGFEDPQEDVNRQVMDEYAATGAVVTGRWTFDLAKRWNGDHHDGVPIFVFSRNPAPAEVAQWPAVTYIRDITEAMRLAKEAAGERDVLVHGIGTARMALEAGVLDELSIHLVPVLLGGGRRLFEESHADHIELEPTKIREGHGVTHLRYRVRR